MGWNRQSPRPKSFSAPVLSRMILESMAELTAKAARLGMLALIRPVITSAEGRCVATIRWMPAARPSWAMRQMQSSTSSGATIIRSANSSIITTTRGRRLSSSVCMSL